MISMGILIFVDDYFNCLTVGVVMGPIADKNKVSREKMAYIIDSTAAPICIIAPISNWAAAVSSSLPSDSSINGFDIKSLIGEKLVEVLSNADYRIFNLEVPLTDIESPIEKCGPILIAPTSTIQGIKSMNPSLLCLANNHILDQGNQGLVSTVNVLDEYYIDYIGVGKDIDAAYKSYIFEKDGIKIGIYNCAEHEFSIASASSGANPFDPLESLEHIAELKRTTDYVIVIYHGGKEHYRYPSPNLQKVCRKMVEKGADVVVCQHSHCIGCEEEYLGGRIVYGQGNFLFDDSESEFWETSLLINIEIHEELKVNYIPICKNGNKVQIASDRGKKILQDFEQRSKTIKIDGFVEKEYEQFAKSVLSSYLYTFSGFSSCFLIRVINKVSGNKFSGWIVKKIITKRKC